jgi:Cdc6-like AAA superfamily ATPase
MPRTKRGASAAESSSPKSVYAQARVLLHLSSAPTSEDVPLVGRDSECDQLVRFLSHSFPHVFPASPEPRQGEEGLKGGKALYVSGSPGTGKTAVVSKLVDTMKTKVAGIPVAMLNCTTLGKDVGRLWSTLADILGLRTKVDTVERFKEIVTAEGNPMCAMHRASAPGRHS